jgi:hypothetical protein
MTAIVLVDGGVLEWLVARTVVVVDLLDEWLDLASLLLSGLAHSTGDAGRVSKLCVKDMIKVEYYALRSVPLDACDERMGEGMRL